MGSLVVFLLLALWASILLPGMWRDRRSASPFNSITSFERCMSMLAPTRAGHPPGRKVLILRDAAAISRTGGRSRVLRRRRALLQRLVAGTAVAAVVAVVVGGPAWWLLGLAASALGAYVILLAQLHSREVEVHRKVRRLPPRPPRAPASGPVTGNRAVGDSATVMVRRWND